MDADLKERWATALESGKYAQGKGALRSASDKFCCLGVLCDLIDPTWTLDETGIGYEWRGEHMGALPYETELELDLVPRNAEGENGTQDEFIAANDARNKTFPEIAQMVRAL